MQSNTSSFSGMISLCKYRATNTNKFYIVFGKYCLYEGVATILAEKGNLIEGNYIWGGTRVHILEEETFSSYATAVPLECQEFTEFIGVVL